MKKHIKEIHEPKNERHDFIVHFKNMKFGFTFYNENMNETDYETVGEILETIENDIWIDKTYVSRPENFRNDTFITEKAWDSYCSLVEKLIENKNSKFTEDIILEFNIYLSMMYIYSILDKYNYSEEDVELTFDPDTKKAKVEYYYDKRERWEEY